MVRKSLSGELARDAAFVLGWFAVVGLLAAVVWWQVTPLAEYTRTTANAEMDEVELGRQVAADGWYVVIAVVGGLLSGVALLALRRRDPVATVVLVTLGALLAGGLMMLVGLWLGPADPKTVLPGADVGDKVPMQLETHASTALLAWPVAALLGAVGVLWGVDHHQEHQDHQGPATPAEDTGSDG